jgi:hypothetical protein
MGGGLICNGQDSGGHGGGKGKRELILAFVKGVLPLKLKGKGILYAINKRFLVHDILLFIIQ